MMQNRGVLRLHAPAWNQDVWGLSAIWIFPTRSSVTDKTVVNGLEFQSWLERISRSYVVADDLPVGFVEEGQA